MQSLEVSGAVRPLYGSLGVKRLTSWNPLSPSGPVTGLLYLYLLLVSGTERLEKDKYKSIIQNLSNTDCTQL